jgi:hypothetical protein
VRTAKREGGEVVELEYASIRSLKTLWALRNKECKVQMTITKVHIRVKGEDMGNYQATPPIIKIAFLTSLPL